MKDENIDKLLSTKYLIAILIAMVVFATIMGLVHFGFTWWNLIVIWFAGGACALVGVGAMMVVFEIYKKFK